MTRPLERAGEAVQDLGGVTDLRPGNVTPTLDSTRFDDPRLRSTVAAIWKGLSREGWLFRYRLDDGFGPPAVAFTLCTFWLVEALAAIGRADDAKNVMEHVHSTLTPARPALRGL